MNQVKTALRIRYLAILTNSSIHIYMGAEYRFYKTTTFSGECFLQWNSEVATQESNHTSVLFRAIHIAVAEVNVALQKPVSCSPQLSSWYGIIYIYIYNLKLLLHYSIILQFWDAWIFP